MLSLFRGRSRKEWDQFELKLKSVTRKTVGYEMIFGNAEMSVSKINIENVTLESTKHDVDFVKSIDNNHPDDFQWGYRDDDKKNSNHNIIKWYVLNDRSKRLRETVYAIESLLDLDDEKIKKITTESKGDPKKLYHALKELCPVKEESWFSFIWNVLLNSKIRKYINNQRVTINEADSIVNTFTLVSALLLAIPFGLLSLLNSKYWQQVHDILSLSCSKNSRSFEFQFSFQLDLLYATIYCSTAEILFAGFYYLLRPYNQFDFDKWFHRGRLSVFFMFLCTGISGTCLLALFWFITDFNMHEATEENYCNPNQPDRNRIAFVTMLVVVGFVIVFTL